MTATLNIAGQQVVLTKHALDRHLRRIGCQVDVTRLLRRGKVRTTPPGVLTVKSLADLYLVAGEAVFPLIHDEESGVYVAVTCLRRHQTPKADRRARRLDAREEAFAMSDHGHARRDRDRDHRTPRGTA